MAFLEPVPSRFNSFATSYLPMYIIKVNATNSTNDFARELYRRNPDCQTCCVQAYSQTRGRGQRGSGWMARPGQNLTFSLLYPGIPVKVNHQFLLSATVSLSLRAVLAELNIPEIAVKWPNDIMSGHWKLGGILIENILRNNQITASIIGIGLNINQTEFPDLPRAGSLKMLTGKDFDLEGLLEKLLQAMEIRLDALDRTRHNLVLEEYVRHMFRRDKISVFQLPDGSFFNGIIRGVTISGRLKVEIEDSALRTFDLKEVTLSY